MIKRSEYLKKANEAFDSGRIDEATYDAMLMNIDCFCEEDDDDEDYDNFPEWYAEVEYSEERMENDPEAVAGAMWDDKNYLHYRER